MGSKSSQFKPGNIPWNKGIKSKCGGRKPILFDLSKANELYNSGLSLTMVSKFFGISYNTLARRFKCSNIILRSKSEEASLTMNKPEAKFRRSQISKKRWSKPFERERMSLLHTELNRDLQYKINRIKNSRKAQAKIKTKPEIILEPILKDLGFKYTGDGKFYIEAFNPDFVNKEKKLIIEVYGDYWHNLPKYNEIDSRRIKIYNKYNYKTLILWEHEINNIDTITIKLQGFIQ